MKTLIVKKGPLSGSETFIMAHADLLPGAAVLVHGQPPREFGKLPKPSVVARYLAAGARARIHATSEPERTATYVDVIQRIAPEVVLAEYGPTGVAISEACRRCGVPLVVHFHGYDASAGHVLATYASSYREMFDSVAATIVVSRPMLTKLLELGAPHDQLHHIRCGVDVEWFAEAPAADNPPVFVAVGRLVEKKGPLQLLAAFEAVSRTRPEARLRVVGDGPLRSAAMSAIRRLGLGDSVSLLGALPHPRVRAELQKARAFVQHSLTAPSGDSEGTPVAIMEASASALPIVSTLHAGIPEIVTHGRTGLLVPEGDVAGMAAAMLRMVDEPVLAGEMGLAGRERALAEFGIRQSIDRLAIVLGSVARAPGPIRVSGDPLGSVRR